MKLEERLERGTRAERLLKDDLLTEAFALVKQAIIENWEGAPLRDRDGAHELKLMLKLLGDVRANLEQALRDGTMAAEDLKRIKRDISPAEWRASQR